MKISVVTVSYNAAATLADTLHSVARQTHADVEHLLIDGDSTDDTMKIARRYGGHLAVVVSERDRGLYDAMNKGARLSTGDVIGFLNADDWYADADSLAWIAAAFEKGADVVYANLALVGGDSPYPVRRIWSDGPHVPADFFRRGWQPAHPTTFVRREVFERAGGFDLRWRISADYAFLAAVMKIANLRLANVPRILVNMRLGGASTAGASAVRRANRECAAALAEQGVAFPWVIIVWKLARKLTQVVRTRASAHARNAAWRPWDEQASGCP